MSLQTVLDIPYGIANGRSLSLDAVRPNHDTGSALPVVVWLHGGGWYSGNKRNAINNHMLDGLVYSGFVLASVEYRLSGEAPFPAQIHDVKAAIRWLRAHPDVLGIDLERIAVAGFSSGGHLAALVATTVGVDKRHLKQWNHKYDGDNLKRAMDFAHEFEHKIVVCGSADDFVTRVTRQSARTSEEPITTSERSPHKTHLLCNWVK
jgi:alpha/beta superfamily hydrolase